MQKSVNPIVEFIKNPYSECLTTDQMIAYAKGHVTLQQRHTIEIHIADCELCAEALSGAIASDDHFADIEAIHRINKNLTTAQPLNAKSPSRIVYYAAAAVLFIILTGFYFMQKSNPGKILYTQSFEPYPNTIPLVRGPQSGEGLENAMMHYELGQYDDASKLLSVYLASHPNEIMPAFYQGVADLARGEIHYAAELLNRVAGSNDPQWAGPARWYLALAYVKLEDNVAARQLLTLLSETPGDFSHKASALLLQLH